MLKLFHLAFRIFISCDLLEWKPRSRATAENTCGDKVNVNGSSSLRWNLISPFRTSKKR